LGQLGLGTMSDSSPPEAVMGVDDLVDLRAGRSFTCAVRANGSAACWGFNSRGQLGDGTTVTSASPVEVSGLRSVRTIAPGMQHTCALLTTGWVECWGSNYEGMLGDGTITDSATPVVVQGLSDASALAATGELALSGHSCALSGGMVRCWGSNYHGELGNGSTEASNVPVVVVGLGDAKKLALGAFQSLAIAGSGAVHWGLDWGTEMYLTGSTPLAGLDDATALSAGGTHACALRSAGTVWCWGRNEAGQLGDGTYDDRIEPVETAGLTDVVQVSAGYEHTCALVVSGAVYCWGHNESGELGSSGFDSSPTPVVVPGVGTRRHSM
jgi:alpha-tubulin suppressor-like RCC1 family protein